MAQKQCKVCGDYYDSSERVCPYCGDGKQETTVMDREVKDFRPENRVQRRKPKKKNPLIIILLMISVFLGISVLAFITNVNSDNSYESSVDEVVVEEEVFNESVDAITGYETEHVVVNGDIHEVIEYFPNNDNFVSINFQDNYVETLEFNRADEPFNLYYNFDDYYYDIASYYDYANEYFLDEDGYVLDEFEFQVLIGDFDDTDDREMLINVVHPDGLFSTKLFKIIDFGEEEMIVELFSTAEFEFLSIDPTGLMTLSFEGYVEYYHIIDNDVIFIGTHEDFTASEIHDYLYKPYPIKRIFDSDGILSKELNDNIHQNGAHFDVELPYTFTIEGSGTNTVTTLLIYNGDFSTYEGFWNHGRIKNFTVTFPDGSSEDYEFYEDDTSILFFFDPIEVEYMDITVTDIFPGESNAGFFLTEIRAYE